MGDDDIVARYQESEFALLEETATDAGLEWTPPQVTRVSDGPISALRWGTGSPSLVLLHGGGQNAHTWDTVLLALSAGDPGLSALAVDLPGHGLSAHRDDKDYSPLVNAAELAPFLATHAPDASTVIGMSLGGLTTIALTATGLDVPRRILVDVTPASGRRVEEMTAAQRGTISLMSGPRTYPTFADIVDAVTTASPSRTRSSLRRGVLHNAVMADDGAWRWRYDIPTADMNLDALWSLVTPSETSTLLVRGGDSPFTTPDDIDEMRRLEPTLTVETVAGAGHSVQGDKPVELAAIIDRFAHDH